MFSRRVLALLACNRRQRFQQNFCVNQQKITVATPIRTSSANKFTQWRSMLCQQQQKHTRASVGETLVVRSIWNKLFGKYLLATNIISSGVLMVVGDLFAQEIEFRRNGNKNINARYDKHRLWRMFVVGCLLGPLHHYLYRWMDKLMPQANVRNSITKILVDQFVMSPICILIFFYSACALENKCLRETNEEVAQKFTVIYLIDWLVWPGAQYINFRYLDTKYRVLFVNFCTAIYDIFLSYMKHEYGINA